MKTDLATVAHIWCPQPGQENQHERYLRVSRNSHGGYSVVAAVNSPGFLSSQPVGLDRDGLIALRDALTAEIDATA